MKLFQSYASFTRLERAGLLVLSCALIILIIVRGTMSLWVHPDIDIVQEEKLKSAWAAYKKDHIATFDDDHFKIDINQADSQTLVQIKGIGPAKAHNIVSDRTTNGNFTDLNQIWELGKFSEATIDYLESRLYIDSTGK